MSLSKIALFALALAAGFGSVAPAAQASPHHTGFHSYSSTGPLVITADEALFRRAKGAIEGN